MNKSEMRKGSSVVIIGTDNVRARTPHLIGRIGLVKEAPVHPATWYKIEVNGEILTFRPSALRAYNGNETQVSSAYLENYEKEMLKEKEIKVEKVLRGKSTPRYSSIRKERKPRKNKIPRGACLSVLPQDQWMHTEVRGCQGHVVGILGKVSNVFESGQVIITSATDGSDIQCDPSQLVVMRSDDFDDDTTQSADDNESIDEIFPTTNFGKRSRKISTIIHRKRNDLQAKYRKVIPVSASDIDLVQNIMKTIMSPEFEKEAIHEFMSSCCQTCYSEKWDGAKFCWNENCMSSPIYYKRTGAKGPSSEPVRDMMKPLRIIDTLKTANDENIAFNDNIIIVPDMLSNLEKIASSQSPIATIPSVPVEVYRPMSNSDAFYCSSFSDLRDRSSKARSDSNVTDVENFSPLTKGDDYYSEDEVENQKTFLVDGDDSRMIV